MKIEETVCSPELSETIKNLGVEQKSIYYWWSTCESQRSRNYLLRIGDEIVGTTFTLERFKNGVSSAFTVAELGEILPVGFEATKTDNAFNRGRYKYSIDLHLEEGVGSFSAYDDNEANALAKLLIYVKSIEEVKKLSNT